MSRIVKAWDQLGVLNTNSNRVFMDAKGARELTNCGDLDADGHISLLPGYSKILNSPMVADYTTGTVDVSNGSKIVTGNSTAWLFGPAANLVTSGDMSSSTGWTLAGAWSIGSGVATRTGSGADPALVNAFTPTSGLRYEISYDMTRTAGTLTVTCGGYSHAHTATETGHRDTFVATSAAALTFTADATFAGTVDNVVVQVINQQVFRGDIFIGPDGEYYEIADITKEESANDKITLATAYEGATASAASYTVRHKVWMLAPFKSQVPNNSVTKSQSYVSTTDGTFTGTDSNAYGTSVTYDQLAGDVGPRTSSININGTAGAIIYATAFKPSATLTGIKGIYLDFIPSGTFQVDIYRDTAGSPGTYLYTSNQITSATQLAKTGESTYYVPFTATATLTSGTQYYIGIWTVSGFTYWYYSNAGSSQVGSVTSAGATWYYSSVDSAWHNTGNTNHLHFAFLTYPATAKTYVGEIIDVGTTPTAASTLTINTTPQTNENFVYPGLMAAPYTSFASGDGNTVTWTLNTSANSDMSSPTEVAATQSATVYTISGAGNLKRYYQLTYTLTSATTESTPIVVSASINAPTADVAPSDLYLQEMVGCCGNVYTSIESGATTINTTSSTAVRPAAWCTYNNNFFYRNGGTLLRYWDSIAASDAAVSAMTKADGSAGTDPAQRAYCLVAHNDKLIAAGYVGIEYFSGANTSITETVLTNSGASFTTAGVGVVGYKVRPDTSWEPERLFVITSNTTTTVTCVGSTLITDGRGDVADLYSIRKYYPKTAWYTTEAEPADWPTTNLLNFNTADGDMIQQIVSHNSNLLVICSEQVWLVNGYGPSTPWQKRLLSKSGGTIAPNSVVSTPYDVYWWAEEGIVRCAGGMGVPEVIDTHIRDLTIDAVNSEMRHNIVGALHKGRVYWSYPSSTSNVNDTTLVFDPETGAWSKYGFGMYVPVSVLELTGDTYLKFQEPTSGCLCKIDETVYTYGGVAQQFVHTTSFMAVSDPTELAQYLYLRVVATAGESFDVTVSAAYDYGDTYTSVGTLVPLGSTVSGRTTVNATDTIYMCRFAEEVRGSSISIKLTGTTAEAFKIQQVQIIADPVESQTFA